MKPFDLEAAMRGEPLVTRDGRDAKFVAYVPEAGVSQRLVVLIEADIVAFYKTGAFLDISESGIDLFMAPPPMRSINGYEYPEPVREPLEQEQEYWEVDLTCVGLALHYRWANTSMDRAMLKRGVIHLTKKAAEAHARALILAGGGEVCEI